MDTSLIALALLLLVLLLWWFQRRRGSRPSAARDDTDRLDTIAAWPPQATRVLTSQERTLHATLSRALPDHIVMPQVPLARFIKVPKRHSYADWLRRLGYQSVDFVICDAMSHVIGVIELQPTSSEVNERARKRLARIARTLKAAEIPLHVWNEANLPNAEAARVAILPKPSEAEPPRITAIAPTAPLRTAEGNPFEDTDRDSSQDEFIEAPPSTWFDDLDSGPTPLPQPTKDKVTPR